jgi:23S rRNA pseudouridine2605 synthase
MYEVLVAGNVRPDDVERIGRGVWIADGKTDVSSVRLVKRKPEATLLRVTLREGRNREVRRIFARLGYRVRRLRRVGIGSLGIGSLKPGRHRRLRADEIRELLGSTQIRADEDLTEG